MSSKKPRLDVESGCINNNDVEILKSIVQFGEPENGSVKIVKPQRLSFINYINIEQNVKEALYLLRFVCSANSYCKYLFMQGCTFPTWLLTQYRDHPKDVIYIATCIVLEDNLQVDEFVELISHHFFSNDRLIFRTLITSFEIDLDFKELYFNFIIALVKYGYDMLRVFDKDIDLKYIANDTVVQYFGDKICHIINIIYRNPEIYIFQYDVMLVYKIVMKMLSFEDKTLHYYNLALQLIQLCNLKEGNNEIILNFYNDKFFKAIRNNFYDWNDLCDTFSQLYPVLKSLCYDNRWEHYMSIIKKFYNSFSMLLSLQTKLKLLRYAIYVPQFKINSDFLQFIFNDLFADIVCDTSLPENSFRVMDVQGIIQPLYSHYLYSQPLFTIPEERIHKFFNDAYGENIIS